MHVTGADVISVKGASLVFLTGGLWHGPRTITVRAHGVMNLLPYCVCHLDLWLGPDWYGCLPTDGFRWMHCFCPACVNVCASEPLLCNLIDSHLVWWRSQCQGGEIWMSKRVTHLETNRTPTPAKWSVAYTLCFEFTCCLWCIVVLFIESILGPFSWTLKLNNSFFDIKIKKSRFCFF